MTEPEYWHHFEVIRDEIYKARRSFHTYLAIHEYAGRGDVAYNKINRAAPFWEIQLYGLQTVFMVTLGRLFDRDAGSHSLQKLLMAAAEHPEFYSKASLSVRKAPAGPKPDWLDRFLADAWEPSAGDLDYLSDAIAPWNEKVKLLSHIRNKVFAHRDIKTYQTQGKLAEFVGQAQLADIEQLLYDIYDVVHSLENLWYNGVRPIMGVNNYSYKAEITAEVAAVLDSIP